MREAPHTAPRRASVWSCVAPSYSTTFRRALPRRDLYPLVNVSAHREHGRIHNAQKAVGSLYLVLLLGSYDFRPSSGYWARSTVFQHLVANHRSPALNSPRTLSLPPYVHIRLQCHSPAKLFSKTSSAKSVTPTGALDVLIRAAPTKCRHSFLVTEACHLSIAPAKPHRTPSGAFLSPMNRPTCARPLAFPSGAKHFCAKSPSPCGEEISVNLSQSWLNHVFRVFFSVQRTRGVCHVLTFINK